ncbi:AcaB family transcriptional regulator [Nitrosomonas sp.]|uniref:AcaB family transcriptional regulator n=1 Tax=Nitrosomonas sp. TaxID=42353 RepID=UPI0025D3EC34|nr:AcaB family transcriptional regulator [Nitrosomonas sp.]
MAKDQQQPGSRPYVVQQIPLQSYHAQQVFKRGFEIYSRSIYSLSVVLRATTDEEKIRMIEGVIDEKLNNSNEDLRKEIEQLRKVAEDNGITLGKVDYSNPGTVEAKISSHRAARYVNLIREYDSLIASLDALWLSGMIPDRDYSQKIYEWKRRILRIATHVTGVVRQLAAESRKKEVEEKTEEQTGKLLTSDADPVPVKTEEMKRNDQIPALSEKPESSSRRGIASLMSW